MVVLSIGEGEELEKTMGYARPLKPPYGEQEPQSRAVDIECYYRTKQTYQLTKEQRMSPLC